MAITSKHVFSGLTDIPLSEHTFLPNLESLAIMASSGKLRERTGVKNPMIIHGIGTPLKDLGAALDAHFREHPFSSVSVMTLSGDFAHYVSRNSGVSYDWPALLEYDSIEHPQTEIESGASPSLNGRLLYVRGVTCWVPGINYVDELVVQHLP